MRVSRLVGLLFLCCLISASLSAQQSTPTATTGGPQTPQAASIIQQSIAAMTGGAPVTDVTMTGTFTVTDSSGTQSGTITMVATASGQSKSIVTLPSGTSGEIRSVSGGSASLIVTGADGVAHTINTQTALSPLPGWFSPVFILSSASSSVYAGSYIGQEVRNGAPVQHLAIWRQPPSGPSGTDSRLLQHVTQHDLYLDPSSLLPVEMTFLVHPYDHKDPNKPLLPYRGNTPDRLEDLLFSDYQQVQGRPVAFHIHTSVLIGPGSIVSDIQLSSVSFNTGATIAAN